MQTTPQTATNAGQSPATPSHRGLVRNRHRPLYRLYRQNPEAAWITDGARTSEANATSTDPLHGELIIGTSRPLRAPLAMHSAVGGDHDGPNPGDYLAAALAGCFDRTMRMVANRLDLPLVSLAVAVNAEVDVRGTLCVDPSVPVGFQKMVVTVDVCLGDGIAPQALTMLLQATEHSCVVAQTLRGGVDIEVRCPNAPASA